MDVEWMRQGPYLSHGLHWEGDEPRLIPHVWDDYSEGVILYRTFQSGVDATPGRPTTCLSSSITSRWPSLTTPRW